MALQNSSARNDLPSLPNFSQLSERVWRVMGLNPNSFTLQGTNTYLVGLGPRKILIDCGDGQPDYVPLLIQSLSSIGAFISDIFISHCHKDHWGGLEQILDSKLINSQEIKVHKFPLLVETPLLELFGKIPESIMIEELRDNQIIKVDSDTHLHILYTPGHTKDHCSFYLQEENAVFTADCILGHGTVTFEDLIEYMESLYKIHYLNPTRLYPGHGQVVDDAIERVEQYISIRLAKEKQILDLMNNNSNWTAIELVENMTESSKNYHEDLTVVVLQTVGLHLLKLHCDGKIELVNKEELEAKKGADLYNPNNIFSIVNQKWQLCTKSKL